MIKAVIFDMDGVLIDSEPLWEESMHEVFEGLGMEYTSEMAAEMMGIRTSDIIDHFYKVRPWPGKSPKEVVTEILDKMDQKVKDQGKVKEGVLHAIQYFQKIGLPLALASSSPMRLIQTILSHLQLDQYFLHACSAEKEKFGKPHPAIYLTTAQKLGISPLDCLAIEDSFNGLIAAKAARMKTIAIPEKGAQEDPRFNIADLRFNSLLELSAVFHISKVYL